MDTRQIPPLVGPPARAAILRAQRLNALIDGSLDPEDERRAVRLWRPLARKYPDDLATMHGYVLALARGVLGDSVGPHLALEFALAAEKLFTMDPRSWGAASFAGSAFLLLGKQRGDVGLLERALATHQEAQRRAGSDPPCVAATLFHQAEALHALGRPREARKRLAAAARRDASYRYRSLDGEEEL